MDCVVESVMKKPGDSLRYYLPMIPMQVLFLIGLSTYSLEFLGNYALYNLLFQVLFHLQLILLTIEDLTGATQGESRFPGYDYLLVTVPFALQHLTDTFPSLLSLSPYSQESLVFTSAVAVTLYGSLKLCYIVYSLLAQTFERLNRPSFFFNFDKRALRAA